jgi:hypothetical protein
MIEFDHNHHQIDDCRQLSQQLGFAKFELFDDGRNTAPVFNRDGKLTHVLGNYTGEKSFEILFHKKITDQILLEDTQDLTYYENDVLNQSKINENAYDVINQIDLVDYGKVTTGMEKCKRNCNGVCLELGYTGSATCFPTTTPFDYGTLYKNPTFTYGLDTHKYVKI